MIFTPREIAHSTGCSTRTVRRYLLERFPRHSLGAWWRLDEEEHALVVGELRAAKCVAPLQPRRALHRDQMLLPLGFSPETGQSLRSGQS